MNRVSQSQSYHLRFSHDAARFGILSFPSLHKAINNECILAKRFAKEKGWSRLSKAAADAVKQLPPEYAGNDLGSVCSWADKVRFRYQWSAPLHFINTPDVCIYKYTVRDCEDDTGEKGRCVAGAINNYTTQLLTYNSGSSQADNNLTEALLFLSHFMGDIHQPLHVGLASDRGGNTIDVHWYTRKEVLHHNDWADLIPRWETCSLNKTACPDIYASEGIKAACDWAYKGATEGTVLEDDYFLSRLPIVKLWLAQGGVRLAATLNRIFQ
ncbi:hypothetical protein SADUNF_Sadunf10G0090600 [Salix dunnii]|uniref:Aspergillus nuclease S1 n=1 Tax=Salix dunnii TaxID=1413687 RepID=A0A835JVJ3_9ROSI|nr:hypothetical protein SADUNF_Sadunf10G0090600 [Salix dunnii]